MRGWFMRREGAGLGWENSSIIDTNEVGSIIKKQKSRTRSLHSHTPITSLKRLICIIF